LWQQITATVSDTAGSDGSAAGGALPSAVPCSAKDGATCPDMSSLMEKNMENVDYNVVVSTSSDQPAASTFTQSMVCCTVVIISA